jgi:hypothetical protein
MGWHIRVVAILFVILGYLPSTAQACSCDGTTSIGSAFGLAEKVVLGRIEGRREIPPDRRDGVVEIYPEAAVVKVIDVLKGSAPDEILVSADFMCYRSFNVEDFKSGETYVFPIIQTTAQGVNVLPSCSHSALKLMDGQLYTNELVSIGVRRLEPYMSLKLLKLLLPLGVLDPRGQIIFGGSLALLASLLLTRRFRKRSIVATNNPPADPRASLRSLRWRSGFAIAWMLLCAGAFILAGISEWDWMLWVLGALFAFAAAGIALLWRWSEGISYGLALIWIGICAYLTYDALHWYFANNDEFDPRLYFLVAIACLCVAGMVWCADAVRRRFSAVST